MSEKTQPEHDVHGPILSSASLQEGESGTKVSRWLVAAVACGVLGSGIPSGYSLGVINTPQEIIRIWLKEVVLQKYQVELLPAAETCLWAVIVSIFVFGAILGAPLGSVLANRAGRRTGLLHNHLLSLAAATLLMFSKHAASVEMLLIGRFISGITTGMATCLVPLYLSEVMVPGVRGTTGVIFPLGLASGVLLSQVVGMYEVLGNEEQWSYLLGGYAVLVVVALLLHPVAPPSPTYCYVVLRDEQRGLKALQQLRGSVTKAVLAEESSLRMLASTNVDKSKSWGIKEVIKSPKLRLPTAVAVILNAGQQFAGINAVFYYSTFIFRSGGLTVYQSQTASIGAGVINVLMAALALPLIRRCRRKVLFFLSIGTCIVCQVTLVAALHLTPTSSIAPTVAVFALMIYVFGYGIGLGPVPFMIATEMFPVGPRSVGISLGGASNWLSNLIVGITFPFMQASLGEFSFVFFITSTVFLAIFTFRFVPETFSKESCTPVTLEKNEEVSSASKFSLENET